MKLWAEKIGVSALKLEGFIFGISLRKNNTKSNPKNQLWKIISTFQDIKFKEKK